MHTTASNQPEKQYAGCDFQNTTRRGKFGDALAEVCVMCDVGLILSSRL